MCKAAPPPYSFSLSPSEVGIFFSFFFCLIAVVIGGLLSVCLFVLCHTRAAVNSPLHFPQDGRVYLLTVGMDPDGKFGTVILAPVGELC